MSGSLMRTPFYFLGPYSDREAELAAYIRREHRRGRYIESVLGDPYVQRHGSRGVLHAVLRWPELIRSLGDDVADAIRHDQAALSQDGHP